MFLELWKITYAKNPNQNKLNQNNQPTKISKKKPKHQNPNPNQQTTTQNPQRNKKDTQKTPKPNYNTNLEYISPLKLLEDQDLS